MTLSALGCRTFNEYFQKEAVSRNWRSLFLLPQFCTLYNRDFHILLTTGLVSANLADTSPLSYLTRVY